MIYTYHIGSLVWPWKPMDTLLRPTNSWQALCSDRIPKRVMDKRNVAALCFIPKAKKMRKSIPGWKRRVLRMSACWIRVKLQSHAICSKTQPRKPNTVAQWRYVVLRHPDSWEWDGSPEVRFGSTAFGFCRWNCNPNFWRFSERKTWKTCLRILTLRS